MEKQKENTWFDEYRLSCYMVADYIVSLIETENPEKIDARLLQRRGFREMRVVRPQGLLDGAVADRVAEKSLRGREYASAYASICLEEWEFIIEIVRQVNKLYKEKFVGMTNFTEAERFQIYLDAEAITEKNWVAWDRT